MRRSRLEDTMNTSAVRATVSFVTHTLALSAMVSIAACSRAGSPDTWSGPLATPGGRFTIRFDNEAPTYVDVYLVTDQREWRLGRVAPGARTALRLPEQSLTASGFVRLAVLADAQYSVQAAHDPRAVFTIAQPASQLLSQQWTFLAKPLASAQVFGTTAKSTP